MEKLIEAVDGIESGSRHQKTLGFGVDESLFKAVRTMRSEAEWLVQHVCERLREIKAVRLWGAALRRYKDHEISFVTTNYDRSIEIGCSFGGVAIEDGFEAFDGREFAKWKGVSNDRPVRLLKIHGSTDWYQGEDSSVYKLKHPMPLYGDLAVSDMDGAFPRMTSAIVLPTREKRVNQPPYPDLVAEFRKVAKDADIAIFVGTSLQDPDLLDLCGKVRSEFQRTGYPPSVPTYMRHFAP